MANIWFWSDPHFGHANILDFTLDDGSKMRPFTSVEEMDEHMVQEFNKLVKPSDKAYCLGDVAMHKRHLPTMGRLNGHHRLVRGNHDVEKTKEYLKYFEEIYATRLLDRSLLLSHIPIHPDSLRYDWVNVHGHVHNNIGPLHWGPRYLNVCVEVTDYRPLAMEEVKQRIQDQKTRNQELIEANMTRLGVKRWTAEELKRPVPNGICNDPTVPLDQW